MSRTNLRRRIAGIFTPLTIIITLFWVIQPAYGADMNVGAGLVDVVADGQCSLVEAIENANDNAGTYSDCPAGNGADTIILTAGITYDLINPIGGGFGLPAITDDLTIRGNNATIQESSAGNFALINNAPGNILNIRNVTLAHGTQQTADGGGAIYNSGHLTVNNVTFDSNFTTGASTKDGGAIYVNVSASGSSLDVNNCVFDSNSATGSGGAIYANGADFDFVVRNSEFIHNHASNDGGAIYVNQSPTTGRIAYSTFTDNDTLQSSTSYLGGAIYVGSTSGNPFLLDHLTFEGNKAGGGGGVYLAGAAEILFSTFTHNDATNGGALLANAPLTMTHSAVISNTSDNFGGGLYLNPTYGQILLQYSEISDNYAGDDGGGIILYDNISNRTVLRGRHLTLSGNHAVADGGGIFSSDATAILRHLTVVNNSAGDEGGGMYIDSDSDTIMRNSVVINNSAGILGTNNCDNNNILTSQGFNRSANGALALCLDLNTQPTDDLISSAATYIDLTLADNGGDTRTHAIINSSDAESLWNKVPDGVNGCNAGISLDQRGYTRADGVGAGGAECDIGAYEYSANCATPTVPTNVAIALSGADVVLSWVENAGNFATELWRASDPYFDPTTPGNQTPFNSYDTAFTYYNEVGVDSNHFFVVRGVSGCGTVSADWERVGEFSFAIEPGV